MLNKICDEYATITDLCTFCSSLLVSVFFYNFATKLKSNDELQKVRKPLIELVLSIELMFSLIQFWFKCEYNFGLVY